MIYLDIWLGNLSLVIP